MPSEDPDKQYTSCKGLIFYGGLQRSIGQEPRCLGYKAPLRGVEVIEEDVLAPPPEDFKFIFIGIGMSVYSKEMLSRNHLPLVNGFSQLIISRDSAAEEEVRPKSGRKNAPQQQQEQPPPGAMSGGGRAGVGLPASHSRRESVDDGPNQDARGRRRPRIGAEEAEALRKKDKDDARQEAQAKIEGLLAAGRGRIEKQLQMSVELARVAPDKLRQAARVQATKAQEMPGMMVHTAKRGFDWGASAVRYVSAKLAEQEDEKKK